MKKYDNYKDSGIEWIGEIPTHWDESKIKYLSKESNSLFIDGDWIESKVIIEEGIRYITTGNIKVGYYSEQGSGFISEETFNNLNCTEVFEGDLVISRLNNPIGRACIIPNLNSRIVTSVDNVIFRPDSNVNKHFLLYLFSSKEYFEITELISRGATMQRISRGLYGNIKIPLPPLNEQTTIANYLDHKTSQIDHLIAKKEQFIKLLEEERVAVINQAVTKGLDPNVPMKDSGVEWLGKIPEHWFLVPVKRVIEVRDGTHDTPEYVQNELISFPLITSKDFDGEEINFSNAKMISESDHKAISKRSGVKSGDVLMSMIGGNIGKSLIIGNSDNFSIKNVALFMTRDNIFLAKYLRYYFDSGLLSKQIELKSRGGAQGFLSLGDIRNLIFFKFDSVELKIIIDYLDKTTTEISNVISKTKQEIELLKEYKTSLISEVVTGKFDVRTEKLN